MSLVKGHGSSARISLCFYPTLLHKGLCDLSCHAAPLNGPPRSIDSRLCTGCQQRKLMFDQWLHTCLRPTPLVFAATCTGGRCFSLEHYIVHLLMCTHEQAHYCNLHCVVVVLYYTILYYFTLQLALCGSGIILYYIILLHITLP